MSFVPIVCEKYWSKTSSQIAVLKEILGKYDVLFIGIGNVLKHDDAVGVYIGNSLLDLGISKCVVVEQSIEKFVGKINNTPHEILIFLDAVSFGKEPGYTELIPVNKLLDQTSNTHNISLGRVAEFFDHPVHVLGIQPASVKFGEGMSAVVLEAADRIVEEISLSISAE